MLSKDKTEHGVMNPLTAKFTEALREAIRRAGSQTELARAAGMQQSRISDYLSGRYDLNHLTVGTLTRLFPELKLEFGATEDRRDDEITNEMEKQIISHFRRLTPADKTRFIMHMAADFPAPTPDKGGD